MLDQLWKYLLYANLKKCCFHQDKIRFLDYIVSHQSIQIEKKQIKAVRDWPEPQSICNIQVFLGFTNFYRQFIQGFSKLAAPLTSMLKITSIVGSIVSVEVRDENPEKGGQGVQVED